MNQSAQYIRARLDARTPVDAAHASNLWPVTIVLLIRSIQDRYVRKDDILYTFHTEPLLLFCFSISAGFITSIPISSAVRIAVSGITQKLCTPWLTCDLLDRAGKPFPCADHPEAEAVSHHNPHSNDRVVQCLRVHWVLLRQDKCDKDKTYPQDCARGNGAGERA